MKLLHDHSWMGMAEHSRLPGSPWISRLAACHEIQKEVQPPVRGVLWARLVEGLQFVPSEPMEPAVGLSAPRAQ